MKLIKKISWHDIQDLSIGWGVVWRNIYDDTLIVSIVPLNLFIRFCIHIYFKLVKIFYPLEIERLIIEAYLKGYREGKIQRLIQSLEEL